MKVASDRCHILEKCDLLFIFKTNTMVEEAHSESNIESIKEFVSQTIEDLQKEKTSDCLTDHQIEEMLLPKSFRWMVLSPDGTHPQSIDTTPVGTIALQLENPVETSVMSFEYMKDRYIRNATGWRCVEDDELSNLLFGYMEINKVETGQKIERIFTGQIPSETPYDFSSLFYDEKANLDFKTFFHQIVLDMMAKEAKDRWADVSFYFNGRKTRLQLWWEEENGGAVQYSIAFLDEDNWIRLGTLFGNKTIPCSNLSDIEGKDFSAQIEEDVMIGEMALENYLSSWDIYISEEIADLEYELEEDDDSIEDVIPDFQEFIDYFDEYDYWIGLYPSNEWLKQMYSAFLEQVK